MSKISKTGLQLNGYETVRAPLAGSHNCPCCICCANTRAEFYVMQDGTVWVVTTDGTIGVLLVNSDEFEVKYHAKHYFSWRLGDPHGQGSDYVWQYPVKPPNTIDIGFKGTVMFPLFRDLIGFQIDVDQCVIFNNEGDLLYEGYYDGRRFPLLYNGESNEIREYSTFKYATTAVHFPVINEEGSERWGPSKRFRFTAEEVVPRVLGGATGGGIIDYDDFDEWLHEMTGEGMGSKELEGEKGLTSNARPVLEQLGVGFAGVAWLTDFGSTRTDGKRCGFQAEGVHERYSPYTDYKCPKDPVPDMPGGDISSSAIKPILPRSRVPERTCRPPGDDGTQMQEVFLCEEDKVTKYHKCATEFKPTTALAQQIQGFDLSLCGNFVRVLYRNARVMNNKWYRYVGNVESKELLPRFLPQEFKFDANRLNDLLQTLDPLLKNFDEQDDWGVPKWWNRFVQTYYVYGAHEKTQYQWMRFSDQERTEIPNLGTLEIPGGKLDKERLQRIQDASNATPPQEPSKKDLAGFCEPEGAEKILVRSPSGTMPEDFENLIKEWDPFNPDSYGIRHLDVISVGEPGSQASRKTWYWFNGYDWIKGEGSYQDLRNWSNEDLGFVFYKGLKSLNQCSGAAHVIPANLNRLQCCGDWLIVGLGTDYESRMLFEKDKKIEDWGMGRSSEPQQYAQESFACCEDMFGYTMLEYVSPLRQPTEGENGETSIAGTGRVQSAFFDVRVKEDGSIVYQKKIWEESFAIENAPQFGGCAKGSRYYFLRQTDKKGIYFYRSATYKGLGQVEYGPWRFLKELNIRNEHNFSPAAGCASTKDECMIPCEDFGDTAGSQRYYKGAAGVKYCEQIASGYTICEEETIDFDCSSEDFPTAVGTITHAHCDHYSNLHTPGSDCYPTEPTFRLTSQSVYVVKGTNRVVDSSGNSSSQPSSSSNTEGYSSQTRSSTEMVYIGAHRSYGSNPYNGEYVTKETDAEGAIVQKDGQDVILDRFVLEQCPHSNTLRLKNMATGEIVDSVDISTGEDWGGMPVKPADLSEMSWSLSRSAWSRTTGICNGKIDPKFTLPHRTRAVQGTYGCIASTESAGVAGCSSDAFCACYTISWAAPEGYGGAIACASQGSVEYYKRLTGTIYVADPYAQKIIPINTGMAGTFGVRHVRTNVVGNPAPCNTVETRSVCIDGISYLVFTGETSSSGEERNAIAILLRPPEIDHFNKTVKTYGPITWTGDVFGGIPCSSGGSSYPGHPTALILCGCCGTGIGAVDRPPPAVCHDYTRGTGCVPDLICSNGYGNHHLANGFVEVRIHWQDRIYQYTVGGYTGQKTELRCCGAYSVVLMGSDTAKTGQLYYKKQPVGATLTQEEYFASCCGNAAVTYNAVSKRQRVFIDGEEILDVGNIFRNDPYGTAENNHDTYPLSIDCCDDYYLFYCHRNNKVLWWEEYSPDVWHITVKSRIPSTDIYEQWYGEERPSQYESVKEALAAWKESNTSKMVLLDGTVCRAASVRVLEVNKVGGIAIGPAQWITEGVARPAVMKDGKEKYPAVEEYIFNDPLAPWWKEGEQRVNSKEGVLSLMKTLLGIKDAGTGAGEAVTTVEQQANIYEKRIQHLDNEIDRLARQIYHKQLEAAAMSSDPMMVHLVTAIQIDIVGLNRSRANAISEKSTVQGQLATLHATGKIVSEELPRGGNGIDSGGIWPFGFKVVTGQNIAAAYYKTNFLYNDSRLKAVQCFCDGKFGLFYFAAAGYYWWDTPFVERSHTWEEQTGYNALGNPTYQVWKSHFDLYMGLPNPLKQKEIHHEQPPGTGDGTLLGDWFQKYTPYGAYVFNGTELLSANLDTNLSDDIEPPQDHPMPQLKDRTRPPYHQGWYDPKHPMEDYLFFNDRHAPVRYDRALGWQKPFEDFCSHADFEVKSSMDFLRSPVTGSGNRIVIGANSVLHVFDARLGRNDYNAETLEKIT